VKVTLYIATSIDGFIAGKNGEVDWLSQVEQEGEDYGYADFYQTVDCLVMGSKTYDLAMSFGTWPYAGKKTVVFTRKSYPCDRQDVEFVADVPQHVLADIEALGFKSVWLVGGGALSRSFRQHGLIDEYVISVVPVVLGEGIPLFPSPGPCEKLRLIHSRSYPSGLLQATYRTVDEDKE
jgi:dihydrofolate reductase